MNWLKIKDFRTLLASLFISKLGDYVYEVVFVFIVLENTHNNYLLAGCVYFFSFYSFSIFRLRWWLDGRQLAHQMFSYTLIGRQALGADVQYINVCNFNCYTLYVFRKLTE